MLISREREKLFEAIKYFAAHTKYCGLVKVFKLLFFLDFDHFRQTGRSVTGLQYEAWQMGPVPAELYSELNGKPNSDLSAHIQVEGSTQIETEFDAPNLRAVQDVLGHRSFGDDAPARTRLVRIPAKIKALKKFNPKLFSKREVQMMEQLAEIYRDATADHMSEVSHLKGKPWHTTKTRLGLKAHIDYKLALSEVREGAPSPEEILARIEEREEVLTHFSDTRRDPRL